MCRLNRPEPKTCSGQIQETSMSRYIAKRVLYMLPMLFFVTLTVFLIMSMLPGDPATSILPANSTAEVKAAFNEMVGFTASKPVRFANFLKGLFTGNVMSYQSQKNVFDELAMRFPITMQIGLIAFSIAVIIGVSLGILSAVKQYSFIDSAVTILAVMFAVFLVLDQFNPMMNFVDNPISRWLLAVLCLSGAGCGILGWMPDK